MYSLRATERATTWMLGSPRSGSTWLLNLLSSHPSVIRLNEPLIGAHLGVYTSDAIGVPSAELGDESALLFESSKDRSDYFFSDRYSHVWRPALQRFLLTRIRTQIVETPSERPVRDRRVVIKEPNGSQAAELILGVLPSSRLLVLARDGRDVVDSVLDAHQPNSWATTVIKRDAMMSPAERLNLLRVQSLRWVARTRAVLRAFERHDPSRRYLVRYEDLLARTSEALRPIFDWMQVPMTGEAVADISERLAFEKVPAAERGSGRFHRAASPGLWRHNLTADEQREAARVMGPTLASLGYPD